MNYRLVPFTGEWESAVDRCNNRLQASPMSGAVPFLLPSKAKSPVVRGPVRLEHRVVADEAGEVHGGCLLQTWPSWLGGREVEAVNIQSPLSEGLVDRAHAGLALWMIREILRTWPAAWSVGMGSLQAPYARLLQALKWRVELVPFRFRVLSGRRFLGNLSALQNHPRFGPLAKLGSRIPVLPGLGFDLAHFTRRKSSSAAPSIPKGAADWSRIRHRYAFSAARSPEILEAMYPPGERFSRVEAPGAVGILCQSQLRGHAQFGDLRVATLAEAVCESGSERALIDAATRAARGRGAELLLTNMSDPALLTALDEAGWFSYASNYVMALSPVVAAAAAAASAPVYVSRGDGDGLLNL